MKLNVFFVLSNSSDEFKEELYIGFHLHEDFSLLKKANTKLSKLYIWNIERFASINYLVA